MFRTWHTALGPLETRLERLDAFEVGDCLVGPDLRSVYRVTCDSQSSPDGYVEVLNLTAAPGEDPEGFFAYKPETPMHYVVSGLSESGE